MCVTDAHVCELTNIAVTTYLREIRGAGGLLPSPSFSQLHQRIQAHINTRSWSITEFKVSYIEFQ